MPLFLSTLKRPPNHQHKAQNAKHKTQNKETQELICEFASTSTQATSLQAATQHSFIAIMGALSDRFNLEKQLVFYLSYHDDKVNQWIHFMCIWPILISALTMFADTEPLAPQPSLLSSGVVPYGEYMVLNYSAVIAAVYMTWYILLDPLAGSLGAALVFCAYLFANFVSAMAPQSYGVPGWQLALPVHLIAWTLQFIGHGVFERRKPALLDSLDQALITAPMFVLLEALFPMGYRPELFKKVEKQAKINVKIFREQGTKAKAY